VRVRDIVSGAFSTQHSVTYTATGLSNSDDAVCDTQTQTGATPLVLYLFFADAEGNPTGTVQQYPLTLDLRAGEVQGSIVVDTGNDGLVVQFPPTTDPDTQGYNVYCDPPANQAVAAGPNDSGVPSATACATSSVLVQGGGGSLSEEGGSTVDAEAVAGGRLSLGFQYGQPDAKYLCGYGSASATSIQIAGLKDGDYYNIAVACVDSVGNVGPLSNVACSEPTQSATTAGGISCSTTGTSAPAGTSGLGVLMVAFMAAVARRRRLT
jgi:MYXO-CTERM domain-containing protein